MRQKFFLLLILLVCAVVLPAQTVGRKVAGVVMTPRREVVAGVSVTVRVGASVQTVQTDDTGRFSVTVPETGAVALRVFGKGLALSAQSVAEGQPTENLTIEADYIIPPVHASLVIQAENLEPAIDRRNREVYENTLFGRDDQLLQTLAAGINAGQHEGGGKSLEIRRFGFNLDHGGVNGGLKILVDNFQQNQGTQGHGQGYLGQLKSLTPELVDGVEILNGPFSAQYGDFSGLGVVHIRLRESLPDQLTLRLQGGSFDSFRTFAAYSPQLKDSAAFIAYEGSRTDGPFQNPLRYRRDNLTGNFTHRLSERRAFGVKFNAGRNNFFSSGQIPLDEIFAGRLDRFGALDPDSGGRVRTGVGSIYYRTESESGRTFKADGFLARSLFDLFSNFTFFQLDPVFGDEIQQHDSRLQSGGNVQVLQPYKLNGNQALLTFGGGIHDNRIRVGLYPSRGRVPNRKFLGNNLTNPDVLLTDARAKVTNASGYVQNGIDFLHGHLHVEAGLRFDYFRFRADGFTLSDVREDFSGTRGASRLQPKAAVSYAPSERVPVTFYANYGRGISSQDARGVVQYRGDDPISTTDFYQAGGAYNARRFSFSAAGFLIDRSNEQVYIPDDGSFEFQGPSRAYGFELRNSITLTDHLSFNAGLTRVADAFLRGTSPREYITNAPHTVANAAFTFANYRGFTASLNYRHTNNYRLDSLDNSIRAAGLDVLDFSLTKNVRRWIAFNVSLDNLTGKRYFETQNYGESRISPTADIAPRIHVTPGYPFTATVGVTFRLFAKEK